MKSSLYHFHIKTKILADFQICISVPLKFISPELKVKKITAKKELLIKMIIWNYIWFLALLLGFEKARGVYLP